MAEFTYNIAKNTHTGHTIFKLNCDYHLPIFFKDEVYLCLKSRSVNKPAKELRELMSIYQQNLLHA